MIKWDLWFQHEGVKQLPQVQEVWCELDFKTNKQSIWSYFYNKQKRMKILKLYLINVMNRQMEYKVYEWRKAENPLLCFEVFCSEI